MTSDTKEHGEPILRTPPPHQGLIEELRELLNFLAVPSRKSWHHALTSAISALSSQQSEGGIAKWIPWKPGDALPEVGRKYWCAIKRTSQDAPTYTPKTRWQDSDWSACDGGGSVLAYWSAPLPPPYAAALEAAAAPAQVWSAQWKPDQSKPACWVNDDGRVMWLAHDEAPQTGAGWKLAGRLA